MKILIVGENSFIGRGVGAWFAKKQPAPEVEYISVRDDGWKTMDLSSYDGVIFAAALVHRPEVRDWEQYELLNVMLPVAFAKYAKAQGVKQFLFFSSVSVYAMGRSLPKHGQIDANTPLKSVSFYGKSKLQAEEQLQQLTDECFCVSVVRPVFVYGKGCRGKHIAVLESLAKKIPVLPRAFTDVKMGMVYIDNLAELCWLIVNSGCSGVYHAQDKEPLSTYEVLHTICPQKRSISCTGLVRPFMKIKLIRKLFGGFRYTEEVAACKLGEYRVVSAEEGIRRTVM